MTPPPEGTRPRPRLSAVVLAAGGASRMGGPNKLLLPLGGRTVLGAVLDAVAAGPFAEAVVVTGRDAEAVAAVAAAHLGGLADAGLADAGLAHRLAHNAAWADGMGGSVAAGVRAASARADGYAVVLGDAPFVRPDTLVRLADAFAALPGRPAAAVVAPQVRGRRGHPVLFARALRDDLLALVGDVGARGVAERHAALCLVPTDDEGVVLDLDTPAAYRRALARLGLERPPSRPRRM